MNVESFSNSQAHFSITPLAGFCGGATSPPEVQDMERERPVRKPLNRSPNNMRVLREALGLSQADCCRKLKWVDCRWCVIEKGQRVSKRTARRIAKVLKAKPIEVFPDFNNLRNGYA